MEINGLSREAERKYGGLFLMAYAFIAFLVLSPYLGLVFGLWMVIRNVRHVHWGSISHHPVALGFAGLALWAGWTASVQGNWISFAASMVLWMYAGFILLLQEDVLKTEHFFRYGKAVLFFGMISASVGCLQYLEWIPAEKNWFYLIFGLAGLVPDPEQRITATFTNANLAGAWFACLAFLALFYMKEAAGLRKKGVYLFCAAVFVALLFLTGSRGAFAGFLAGFLVYALYFCRRSLVKIGWVCGGFGLALFLMPEWMPRFDVLYGSLADRWLIWQMSWKLYLDHFLQGIGLAGMYFLDPALTGYHRYAHAHNTLLSVLMELGTIGGLIFLWMHAFVVKYLWRLGAQNHPLAPLLTAVFVFFVVHGFVDYPLMSPQVGMVYVFVLGMIVRSHREAMGEISPAFQKGYGWKGKKSKTPGTA